MYIYMYIIINIYILYEVYHQLHNKIAILGDSLLSDTPICGHHQLSHHSPTMLRHATLCTKLLLVSKAATNSLQRGVFSKWRYYQQRKVLVIRLQGELTHENAGLTAKINENKVWRYLWCTKQMLSGLVAPGKLSKKPKPFTIQI